MGIASTRIVVASVVLAGVAACTSSTGPGAVRTTHPAGTIYGSTALTGRPYGVAVSKAGAVYVTRLDADSLARFDLPDTVIRGAAIVGHVPTDVAFSLSGAVAYVANQFSQALGVVTASSNVQASSIPALGNPFKVAVAPTGARVYVATNAGVVVVVDAATRMPLDTVTVGADPNGLAFSPNGQHLYTANFSSGTLSDVDLGALGTAPREITVGGAPQGLAVSPDGSEAYVANMNGYLYVLNLGTGAKTDSTSLGSAGFEVALTPDGTQLWVGLIFAGKVRVLDRATRALVKDIPTGGDPRRIAFNADGSLAVIANQTGWVDFVR